MLKRLELSFRRLLLRLLQRNTLGQNISLALLPDNAKILLLRHDKIGDVLVTVPMIRILRGRFPKAKIDIVLGEKNQTAYVSTKRYINHNWMYSKSIVAIFKLIHNLRSEKYDVIIDCMDNPSSTSRAIITLLSPQYSVGLSHYGDTFYTHAIESPNRSTTHIVERTAQLVSAFQINYLTEDLSLEFPITQAQQSEARRALGVKNRIRLGINISAGWDKYWGRENTIELCRQLEDIDIIGFATMDFQSELQEITKQTSMRPAPVATSLTEFAAMLHECDIVFTPDTSVVHLAAAWKKPCIVLYANVIDSLMLWTPYKSPYIALTTRDSSLSAIGVGHVIEAIRTLLQDNVPK